MSWAPEKIYQNTAFWACFSDPILKVTIKAMWHSCCVQQFSDRNDVYMFSSPQGLVSYLVPKDILVLFLFCLKYKWCMFSKYFSKLKYSFIDREKIHWASHVQKPRPSYYQSAIKVSTLVVTSTWIHLSVNLIPTQTRWKGLEQGLEQLRLPLAGSWT